MIFGRLPSIQRSRVELVPFGGSVKESPEAKKKLNRYVDGLIDPENTLDLQEGRPRLLRLKEVPFRIQFTDEAIADAVQFTEREFSIIGQADGSTVLNFWFSDPENLGRTKVLSYLVRVFPELLCGSDLNERITLLVKIAFQFNVVQFLTAKDRQPANASSLLDSF